MATKQELTDKNETLRAKNEELERRLAEREERGGEQPEDTGTALATTGEQPFTAPLNQLALAMGINEDLLDEGERVEDAMAKAIEHDRKIREEMRSELAASRMVINRLASIMGVQKWDADGSEIVEKAQRWVGFAGALKKRLKVLQTSGGDGSFSNHTIRLARLEEVTAVYAQFMGTGDLAAWLATIPSNASTEAMIDAIPEHERLPAGSPIGIIEDPDDIKISDVEQLIEAVDYRIHEQDSVRAAEVIRRMKGSRVSMEQLAKVFSLVIIPHLRKIGA